MPPYLPALAMMTSKQSGHRNLVLPLALLGMFLLVSWRTMGIVLSDDLWYMLPVPAVKLTSFTLGHYWSPLYCLWLQKLAVICPNPVWLYFLSWGLIVSVVTLLPALFRLRHAWLYALVLVAFPFLDVTPFLARSLG